MWVGLGGWGDACVYVPFYAGMTRLPNSYTTGVKTRFNWDSAYWLFNLVANWARLHYARMIGEIKNVQHSLETAALNKLEGIDEEAYSLYREDPALASEFLNETCIRHAEEVLDKWRELAAYLIAWYSHNSWFGDQVEAPAWWREVLQKDKN